MKDGKNRGETERQSEEREGRKDDSKMPGGAVEGNKGRKRESPAAQSSTTPGAAAPPLHHGPERLIARRLTEDRWRKRGEESEERTTEGQGDGWREQLSA